MSSRKNAEARAAGSGAAADELDTTIFAAFTASSEMLQGLWRFLGAGAGIDRGAGYVRKGDTE